MRQVLAANDDPRAVVADPAAGYFGITVSERTLVPGDGATTRRDPTRGLAARVRRDEDGRRKQRR